MAAFVGDVTTYLDRSIPELRGEHVHFTATSGGAELHVCMSRREARKMATKVIQLLDAAALRKRLANEPGVVPFDKPPR